MTTPEAPEAAEKVDDSQLLRDAVARTWRSWIASGRRRGTIPEEHRALVGDWATKSSPANKVVAALGALVYAGIAKPSVLHRWARQCSGEIHSPVYDTATWAVIGAVARDFDDAELRAGYLGWLSLRSMVLCRPQAIHLHVRDRAVEVQPQVGGYRRAVCAMSAARAIWPSRDKDGEPTPPVLHWLRWLGSALPAEAVGFPGADYKPHSAYDDYAEMAWVPAIDTSLGAVLEHASAIRPPNNERWWIWRWPDGSRASAMSSSRDHTRGPVAFAYYDAQTGILHLWTPSRGSNRGGDNWIQSKAKPTEGGVRIWAEADGWKKTVPLPGGADRYIWDGNGCRIVGADPPPDPEPPKDPGPGKPPAAGLAKELKRIERHAHGIDKIVRGSRFEEGVGLKTAAQLRAVERARNL